MLPGGTTIRGRRPGGIIRRITGAAGTDTRGITTTGMCTTGITVIDITTIMAVAGGGMRLRAVTPVTMISTMVRRVTLTANHRMVNMAVTVPVTMNVGAGADHPALTAPVAILGEAATKADPGAGRAPRSVV